MKNFVRIQSSINISVVPSLVALDVSNPDAHVADRLKVQPLWANLTVDIKQGTFSYPAYITEWATVKALAKDKLITIGMELDDAEVEAEAIEKKEKLDLEMKSVEEKVKPVKKVKKSLDEIVGE